MWIKKYISLRNVEYGKHGIFPKGHHENHQSGSLPNTSLTISIWGTFKASTRGQIWSVTHLPYLGVNGCLSGQRSWHHHHRDGDGCEWRPSDQALPKCSPVPGHLASVLHVPIWHRPQDRLTQLTGGRKHLQLQRSKWARIYSTANLRKLLFCSAV